MQPTDQAMPQMLALRADYVRDVCESALAGPLGSTALALAESGITRQAAFGLVREVAETAGLEPIRRLRAAAARHGAHSDARVERVLLVAAALEALPAVAALPVSDAVRMLFYDRFLSFAGDPGGAVRRFEVSHAAFAAMCKVATLRRFPGGQFDWEIGGIRGSDVAAVRLWRLPATLSFIAFRMGGLSPVFFSHLNWQRPNGSLREDEANRSYYRMARSLELQPEVKGFAACSWFQSPATHRVSPQLAWLNDVFRQNGGFIVEAGCDAPEGGALHRSPTRQRLYEAGRFRPTRGLAMWPREAMLRWAAAHPELAA